MNALFVDGGSVGSTVKKYDHISPRKLGLVPFSCNVRKRHYSEYLLVNYRPLNCTVLKSIVTIKIHTEPL